MPITTNGNTLIKDGLVLYLDAANKRSYPGSGTTWYDLSGNKNNGTLTNAPTFSSANKGCFEFNGSSNFITLGNILNLTSQTQLTLSAWQYKKNNSDGISNAIFTSENNNTSGGILFYNHATGPNKLLFAVDNNTPTGYLNEELVYSNDSLSLDSWQHVCSVFNSGNVYNYINGVLNGVGTGLASSITMNKPCYIGKRPNAGFEAFFDGFISTFQIYNTSLNATQVLQNYNATKGRYL